MRNRTWTYVPYNVSDETYFGCDTVVAGEWAYVRERRLRQHDPDPGDRPDPGNGEPPPDLRGIALSGGGIRSASFCLGILQALSYARWLKKLDYVSMVSGGSYVGGSLAWLLHRKWDGPRDGQEGPRKGEEIVFGVNRETFPFGSYPMVGMSAANPVAPVANGNLADEAAKSAGLLDCYKGRLLRYLRQHASYLMPGDGINAMSLLAVVLRNSIFSIVVYGGLLVAFFCLLGPIVFCQGAGCVPGLSSLPGDLLGLSPNGALVVAMWLAILFLGMVSLYPLVLILSRRINTVDTGYSWRYGFERRGGQILLLLGFAVVIGAVPYAYDWLQSSSGAVPVQSFHVSGTLGGQGEISVTGSVEPSRSAASRGDKSGRGGFAVAIGTLSTLLGGISTLLGYLQAGKARKIPTGLVVAVGSVSLIFGLLVLAYAAATALVLPAPGAVAHGDPGVPSGSLWSQVRYAEILEVPSGMRGIALLAFGLLYFFLLRFANLNYLSIHRYYRDRLMETFMPDPQEALDVNGPKPGGRKSADGKELKKIAALEEGVNLGPYPIINTNVVLVSSRIPKFRGRGGDNFILTPRYCGSNATGWCSTGDEGSPFSDLTLPTAIATSGAAIDPNTGGGGEGVTRSPVLSFLMGFFNVRLGYWVENPTPPKERLERIRQSLDGRTTPGSGKSEKTGGGAEPQASESPSETPRAAALRLGFWDMLALARHKVLSWPLLCGWGTPNALYPGLTELYLRESLDENSRMVQLSDGGHFENLGLYELVRRRLRLIIVCDGAAHPTFGFDDLGNAIEKVRADFGALIDIDCETLKGLLPGGGGTASDNVAAFAKRGYLRATIKYHTDNNEPFEGTLIYLTATFFEHLSADLYAYRRAHPEFPNQTTADQFFDEKQFEAYRELGYQTAYEMLSDAALMADPNVRNTVGRPDVKSCRGLLRWHPQARNWW